MPSTKCLLHKKQPPLVNGCSRDMNSKDGSFWFGSPALGRSPWVGLLLRWSHSCLFVECPYFVPRLLLPPLTTPFSVSLSLSYSPLFFLLLSPNFTSPQGVLAPLHLRKGDAFCDFSSWFFLFSQILCRNAWWEGNLFFASIQLCYSVDQFQQGLGKGEGMEGEGKNRIRAPTVYFVLFDF